MMTFRATSSRDEKYYSCTTNNMYRIKTSQHVELASYRCWLSPLDLLTLFILQLSILVFWFLTLFFHSIGRPNSFNAELERPLDAIRQSNSHAVNLLPEDLCLWLDDKAVICAYKVIPSDENSLPLARPF